MKAKRHFIQSVLLAVVVALAGAMAGKAGAGVETIVARIPVVASPCEGRRFVVAGAGGMGMTSLDGVSWIPKAVTVTTNWRSHCRGSAICVGIGRNGSLLTSYDGTNWTARDAHVPFALHGVTHGNGRFVAVGNEGAVVSSDDGTNWTTQDSGTDERLRGVAHGNGVFVAVGYVGTILVSRDGTHWQRRPSPTDVRLLDIAFGNGIFVAAGWHGWILTSTDGLRWRRIRSGTKSHLWRVVFGDNSMPEGGAPIRCKATWTRSGAELLPAALPKLHFPTCDKFGEPIRQRNSPGTTKQLQASRPDTRKVHT